MKLSGITGWMSALGLGVVALQAGETNQVEQLQKQLRQLQQQFEQTQQTQRQQIEALQDQIKSLQASPATNAATPPSPATNAPTPTATGAGTQSPRWNPAAPITLLGGQQNYLNFSLDALLAAGSSSASDIENLEVGGHDPNQRGFTLQNLEVIFDGAVDPYFRAQANLIFYIDSSGESHFELEEAFAETMSLPGNFQARAGQYLTEFGRLNPTHPHAWDFVDQPLVNGRFLGPDGLRNPGARVSWLAPTPFYTEAFLSIQDSQGEAAYSFNNDHDNEVYLGRVDETQPLESFGDLLFAPRLATSFDLTAAQTALMGVSGAFGPNASGHDTETQIYGIDLFWKWKSPRHHGGFPFVSWQSEAMLRRYEAGAYSNDLNGNGVLDPDEPDVYDNGTVQTLASQPLLDYGFYSQLAWGFKKGWVAALRGDWVSSNTGDYDPDPDPDREKRWRIAPNLTFYPTEFSKLRLQYNYDHRQIEGVDHSIWVQFEFLLGAHAAHKF